jgi:hypothetical protein
MIIPEAAKVEDRGAVKAALTAVRKVEDRAIKAVRKAAPVVPPSSPQLNQAVICFQAK